MPAKRRSRGIRRLIAVVSSLALAACAVGVALANDTNVNAVKSIVVTSATGSYDVTLSGEWVRPQEDNHYVGWAVSWGDENVNPLTGQGPGKKDITLFMGAENTVHSTGQNGNSGPWSIAHTYTTPGTYLACVLMYDLGQKWPDDPDKKDQVSRWVAAGTRGNEDHNADNSLEDPRAAFSLADNCVSLTVPTPEPSPSTAASPSDAESRPSDAAASPSDAESRPSDAVSSPSEPGSEPSKEPKPSEPESKPSDDVSTPSQPASSPSTDETVGGATAAPSVAASPSTASSASPTTPSSASPSAAQSVAAATARATTRTAPPTSTGRSQRGSGGTPFAVVILLLFAAAFAIVATMPARRARR